MLAYPSILQRWGILLAVVEEGGFGTAVLEAAAFCLWLAGCQAWHWCCECIISCGPHKWHQGCSSCGECWLIMAPGKRRHSSRHPLAKMSLLPSSVENSQEAGASRAKHRHVVGSLNVFGQVNECVWFPMGNLPIRLVCQEAGGWLAAPVRFSSSSGERHPHMLALWPSWPYSCWQMCTVYYWVPTVQLWQ